MSYKNKSICLKFSIVVLFLLILQAAFAQKKYPEFEKAVDAKKGSLGNEFVAVVANADSVLYQKEYGGFLAKTPVPITSASMWLTTALVLQLADEGKLSLDDKVSKYLPVFESYGKAYITIRQCLTHMTGIQAEGNKLTKIFERKKFTTLDEEILAFVKKEIQTNPGTEFRYNNIGVNIAGKVTEVVTKKKFDLLIRQRLLAPLGMRNTTFSTLDGTAPDPSAGAKSTAADYIKFLEMLLANGKAGGKQILSEAAVAELKKMQIAKDKIKFAPTVMEGYTYALGSWDLSSVAGAGVLACPGLTGTWPIVDFGRGYAILFFQKNAQDEQNVELFLGLKKVADKQFAK